MFSSLLPRPKHSSYDPNYHFRIDKNINKNSQVLVLPQTQVIQTIDFNNEVEEREVTYESTIPLKKRYPNLTHNFPRPSIDDPEVQAVIQETKTIISKIISPEQETEDVKHIQYNTKNISDSNSERIIQIRKFQVDPMLPPQFKLRKNRHKTQSEEIPIVKPTNAKLTKEDREKWNIPAAVSNWKNNQGFTIDLNKRVMGIQETTPQINVEKFGKLSNALVDAEQQAREDIKTRNEMKRKKEEAEARERERNLRDLAQRCKRRKY